MTEFCFQIPNFICLELRWVRLIIIVLIFSTLIYFSPGEEKLLFEVYLYTSESHQWGRMMPSPQLKSCVFGCENSGGRSVVELYSFGVVLFDLGVVVVCNINHYCFRPERVYVPAIIESGWYPSL